MFINQQKGKGIHVDQQSSKGLCLCLPVLLECRAMANKCKLLDLAWKQMWFTR
jgi:hypothetical protein